MNIFISYASEYRSDADRIAIGLRQEGHKVFFDRDQLPPGNSYDLQIRKAIAECDLFIFLVSPESVALSSYALTELGLARKKWDNPAGYVLPVLVTPTPLEHVPAYLSSVTFLKAEGNLTAEVLSVVAKLNQHGRGIKKRFAVILSGLLLIGVVIFLLGDWGDPTNNQGSQTKTKCQLEVSYTSLSSLPEILYVRVISLSDSRDIYLNNGTITLAVDLLNVEQQWSIEVFDINGLLFGPETINGCPHSSFERKIDANSILTIHPH